MTIAKQKSIRHIGARPLRSRVTKGRVYMSGRKVRVTRGRFTPGYRTRLEKPADPRKVKRSLRRSGFRVNPRGGDGVRIVYNKLLGGWYIVRGPHQTPIGGRFDSKESAQAMLRGVTNVQRNKFRRNPHVTDIKAQVQRMGWRFIQASDERPARGAYAPHAIVLSDTGMKPQPYVTHWLNLQDGGFNHGHYFATLAEAKADFFERSMRENPVKRDRGENELRARMGAKPFYLQEKRGEAWFTIAMFKQDQKQLAVTIGKKLHHRHPSRTYRLFS